MHWYLAVLQKYATFSGRARRQEYWMFALISTIALVLIAFVEGILGISEGLLSGLYALAVLLPSLAVAVRRLHDTGRSGWWFLIVFIPFVNLVLIYFMVVDSEPGANQYGPNPKVAPAFV